MTAEISDASSELVDVFNTIQDTSFETWNGREVSVQDSFEKIDLQKEKLQFLKEPQERPLIEVTVRAAPAPRGWNHESFPIPAVRPILTPVPDGETCLYYARSFRDTLLEWMKRDCYDKGLMPLNDLSQIEGILQMLVNDVHNYVVMVGFYNSGIDWKQVLHPLNRLFQFWNYKWERYRFPPSPHDYPLP